MSIELIYPLNFDFLYSDLINFFPNVINGFVLCRLDLQRDYSGIVRIDKIMISIWQPYPETANKRGRTGVDSVMAHH